MSGVLNGPRKSVWISIITGITTAPKKDDPHFFQNVNNRILEFDCDINIILGGGFNLIKKAKLDKEGGILFTSHPKALTEVEEIQINLNLGDIWISFILTISIHVSLWLAEEKTQERQPHEKLLK